MISRKQQDNDDLENSISYSALASAVRAALSPASSAEFIPVFDSLECVGCRIYDLLLSESPYRSVLHQIELKISQTKAPLHCHAVGIESSAVRSTDLWYLDRIRYICEDIECHTIIGVNPAERLEKQLVRLNISIDYPGYRPGTGNFLDFRSLIRRLYEFRTVGKTDFLTLEALASYTALESLKELRFFLQGDLAPSINIKAAKPYALVFASASEVEVCRTFSDYPSEFKTEGVKHQTPETPSLSTAVIAFGSNLGDRFFIIELALRLLEVPGYSVQNAHAVVDILNTSFLYESAPMYVTDQPAFINGACIIQTNLPPLELLGLLKKIEATVGRVPSIRNGPRAVDLDIILYSDLVVDTRPQDQRQSDDNLEGRLVIPHPRMCEREFVLRPLKDMIPDDIHPINRKSIATLLDEVLSSSPVPEFPMQKVIPFPRYPLSSESKVPLADVLPVPSNLTYWTFPCSHASPSSKSRLMAILNSTPDSFSDGSVHNTLSTALDYARRATQSGADILDIGGFSTRPGAVFVSVEDEIARVSPVISAIRKAEADEILRDVPISVDTFRWEVARSAIDSGANCINDVYSFTGPLCYPYPSDDAMEQTIAQRYITKLKKLTREFAVPVVLMHSRGEAGANKDYSGYSYAGSSKAVVEGIRVELGLKVDDIVKGKGGVRRWLVIIDPGIGFSKTVEGNLEILRDLSSVTDDVYIGPGSRRRNPLTGFPSLIGSSRKSFLGTILADGNGRTTLPGERGWATAATVACAVQQGACAVRVHDIAEMADVLRVANSLWRSH
ncbi:Dihydropteroate synthase [Desarmillaria tabescens]|uniref:Dihydropteroate synthase n=1 Tax=Armillaria tabescens TaxID=1929756 RepID=A0AA39NJZ7_ARMTA|nr:Dihydropteroate synthase [Desarmillaria tabescens]KAK0467000.1 Dihydropteroate synthase [Desarmillaria tabescens]